MTKRGIGYSRQSDPECQNIGPEINSKSLKSINEDNFLQWTWSLINGFFDKYKDSQPKYYKGLQLTTLWLYINLKMNLQAEELEI